LLLSRVECWLAAAASALRYLKRLTPLIYRLRRNRGETLAMTNVLPSTVGVVAIGLMVVSAAVVGLGRPMNPAAKQPVWTEVKWPFPLDQWGAGKAFVCISADCGVRVELSIRPKIGYCNCTSGVSDDTELERVSDTDLVSPRTRARGRSNPIKVGWMEGRSRSYWASDAEAGMGLLSVAFNDECDVVVALATFGDGDPATIEPAVTGFLKSTPMVLWAKKELGLEFVRRDW
jgi:hypothetical protein